MKNLFCFHYPNKKEGKFIFQWAEMPHEQEGQAGETPRKPKKTREGKESPEQQMQRAFEKLEQSDIARELKQLCFFLSSF